MYIKKLDLLFFLRENYNFSFSNVVYCLDKLGNNKLIADILNDSSERIAKVEIYFNYEYQLITSSYELDNILL